MLRLSTLFLLACSILVAQTDIIVRKLILRDAADTKFWELAQDPADTTTILLKDDTDTIVLDWDAQDGAKFFTDIITTGNIILDGKELQFRDVTASFTSHKMIFGGANITNILDSGGSVIWSFRSAVTPDTLLSNATIFPGINDTFDLGGSPFRWAKGWFTDLDISGTCTGCGGVPVIDTTSIVEGSVDDTKELRFEVDGFTTGTVRVATPPNQNFNMAGLNVTETFTAVQTFQENIRFRDELQVQDVTGAFTSHKIIFGGANITHILDSGGSVIWSFRSSTSPDTLLSNATIFPGTNNTFELGGAAFLWQDIYAADIHLGKPTTTRIQGRALFANTTDGNVGTLVGISKDGGGTIEANNLFVSGNFYTRSVSGDVTCTTVDDGWMGVQTTAEEIQFCSGTATRLVPSVLTSDTPVTVNCAAGEVIDDPEFKNGILIGTAGTPCIANNAP